MNTVTRILLATSLLLPLQLQAEQVGEIKYARGAITVQNEDGSMQRLTGKGGAVNEGEVIKTGPRSFAIISLDDDTKMTIRPRSSFAVEEYTAEKSSKASALLRLFRGGLRTVTGFISKFNPEGYKVRTSVATIGIRGTEFDARICGDDCAEENRKLEQKNRREGNAAVAKVVFKRGDVKAENFQDVMRELKTRANIFEGDTIITGEDAYAVLVFRDKSRVSLQALTNFRVDELRYTGEKAKQTGVSALFSLLRGGLRTVTGLIGKTNPASYRMRTAVATIGIRGTGYDLLCTGLCAFDGSYSPTPLPQGEGLYAYLKTGGMNMGQLQLDPGEVGYQQDSDTAPVKLPAVPQFFIDNPVPAPETIEVDEDELFADLAGEDIKPGVYVSVTDGQVIVDSGIGPPQVVDVGQAIFAGLGGELQKLPAIPLFQALDVIPSPKNFTPRAVNLGRDGIGSDGAGAICEVK